MDPRIFLLPLGAFAVGTGNIVFVGVLEPLANDLGVSIATAGQLATAFAIAYALSAPLLVSLTARLPRRPLLALALLVFTVANAGMALAPDFAALVPLRVLAALATALYMPIAMGTAVTLAGPGYQGRAMAVVLFGLTAAFLGGIPLGTWLGSTAGWRASFGFAAILGLVSLAVIAPALPRLPGTSSRGLRGIAVVLRPAVAGNLAITTLAFVAVFCTNAYIGPIVTRANGFGGAGIAMMQVVLGLGGVLGVPLGGWLADRGASLGLVATMLAAILLAQPVYSLFMLVPGWSATAASVVFVGAAMMIASGALFALGPVQQHRLIGIAPDERDIVLSLNASALFLGQGIGAALGGLSAHHWSLAANGLVGGAVALATIAGIALVAARGRSASTRTANERESTRIEEP
ncbi:MAG: MFS transporter [Halofilum sp. (in: g-proteobacteria)]|nr:MFS transporter [Halofilum sp. (in: g-proteobacteria)]